MLRKYVKIVTLIKQTDHNTRKVNILLNQPRLCSTQKTLTIQGWCI